ncbi:MAG: hypothetical protein K0S26_2534, partial [Bacteroidota bacterium]|nr:hypothetical protein [Bacteroidota bacterium]
NEAFNYGQFSRTYISEGWGAYEFTKLLGVKTCMYCNRNYTVTFDRSLNSSNVKGKIRPVLDHLFEKAKYPFFGISIYNLVPSCYECNSGLKGVIANEAQEDHLNPYEDGFHDIFHFVDIPAVRNPMHSRDNFDFIAESTYYDIEWENFDNESYDIKILQRKGCKASNDIVSRATINKELFALEELYNEHKEFISPIIFSCSKYGINIFDHLKETFPSFNFTREQWEQLYFGSFIGDKNNFIKRPFSKLIYDIASNYRVI